MADIVAAGDLTQRLAASRRRIASRRRSSAIFGLRPSLTPRALACSRPSLVRVRSKSLSNSASPPRAVVNRPRAPWSCRPSKWWGKPWRGMACDH